VTRRPDKLQVILSLFRVFLPIVGRLDVYIPVFNFDGECRHRRRGRQAKRPTGTNVEARAMARALNFVIFQLPIFQWAIVMRAAIGYAKKLTIYVKHDDGFFHKIMPQALARWYIFNSGNFDEFCHGDLLQLCFTV